LLHRSDAPGRLSRPPIESNRARGLGCEAVRTPRRRNGQGGTRSRSVPRVSSHAPGAPFAMRWSFSAARAFRQCQRSWFFKTCAANARAKDPKRREAYILSKLQNVSGWRGKLVDRIISQELVEALRRRQKITK